MHGNQRKATEAEEPVELLSDYLDSVDETDFDLDVVDAFLEQLGEAADYDDAEGLKRFREKHAPPSEGPMLQALPGKRRRVWRLTGRIAAVAASVALCCMVVCQAMGFDVFGMIGRWSREQFWFEITATPPAVETALPGADNGEGPDVPDGPEKPQRETYDSLEDALEENGFAALAPGWLPEGFQLQEVQMTALTSFSTISAFYERGEENIIFSVHRYESEEYAGSAIYEKDETPVVEYEHNGVVYYIMNNLSRKSIAWRDGMVEGLISGNFSESEAKQIIDSIDG